MLNKVMAFQYLTIFALVFLTMACRSTAVDPLSPDVNGGQSAIGSSAPLLQGGAPGEPNRNITVEEATDLSGIQHTAADVEFMQGMIGHHAQALEMTALLYDRSTWQDIRMLAQRIDVSQADEIKMMQGWLTARNEGIPENAAHHTHGTMLMPGMLTPDQMAELAAATGSDFDRLFLEYMIMHHQGAVIMVEALFASPGAGQESQIFNFSSDVIADQSMEITRMRRMRGMLEDR
ncbi:uncharacterized protein METZ01_LOCUS65662 [marine metagenome]|uniref:DUF305 domain-containing protein n=1 Tax=marine metagenome TaxID=408172 RepID=A0A381TB30_9ZZZZ